MKIIRDREFTAHITFDKLSVGAVFMLARDSNNNNRDYLIKTDINGHHRAINLNNGRYVPIDSNTPIFEVDAELRIGNIIMRG